MSRVRFWGFYAAAWVPYALSYYVLFRLMPFATHPVRETIYNILPAAALGALIVPWARVFSWRWHRAWWFYPAQLGSAVVYSLLWYGGVLLVSSVGQALVTHRFTVGYFSSYAMQWQFFSGLMIYGDVAGVMYVSEVNARLRAEERRRERAEMLGVRSELSALRAQLNPHFLFNTLNSIMALAGPEQPRTMQAIVELAAMLRYTLSQDAEESEGVSLRQELAFTEQYLALESLRLRERLRVVREVSPAALGCRLPPLTLQPLVENAIRHGISPRAGGGTLTLRASVEDGALRLEVEDDGAGGELVNFEEAEGLGLRTVRQRLALFSSGEVRFAIEAAPGSGCRISFCLPQELRLAMRDSEEAAGVLVL